MEGFVLVVVVAAVAIAVALVLERRRLHRGSWPCSRRRRAAGARVCGTRPACWRATRWPCRIVAENGTPRVRVRVGDEPGSRACSGRSVLAGGRAGPSMTAPPAGGGLDLDASKLFLVAEIRRIYAGAAGGSAPRMFPGPGPPPVTPRTSRTWSPGCAGTPTRPRSPNCCEPARRPSPASSGGWWPNTSTPAASRASPGRLMPRPRPATRSAGSSTLETRSAQQQEPPQQPPRLRPPHRRRPHRHDLPLLRRHHRATTHRNLRRTQKVA